MKKREVLGLFLCLFLPTHYLFAEVTETGKHSAEEVVEASVNAPSCVLVDNMYYKTLNGQVCNVIPLKVAQDASGKNIFQCPRAQNPVAVEEAYKRFGMEARKALPADSAMEAVYHAYAEGLSQGLVSLDNIEKREGCYSEHPVLKYLGIYAVDGVIKEPIDQGHITTEKVLLLQTRHNEVMEGGISQSLADDYFSGKLKGRDFEGEENLRRLVESRYDKIKGERSDAQASGLLKKSPVNSVLKGIQQHGADAYLTQYRMENGDYRYSDYRVDNQVIVYRRFPTLGQYKDYVGQKLKNYLEDYIYQ